MISFHIILDILRRKGFPSLTVGLLLFQLFSCSQKAAKPLKKPTALIYDTSVIAIFKWDTAKYYSFPKNSDSTVLSEEDLDEVDSLFRSAVRAYNDEKRPLLPQFYKNFGIRDSTQILIDLKTYKRQYFPFEDVNGERVVFINCFCTRWRKAPYWKTIEETVDDGGPCYFHLTVNLSKKIWSDFMANGYG